jgi:hypothetical protein
VKPDPALVLHHSALKLMLEIGPALPAGYGQGSAGTLGILLLMVAQEHGRAADMRVAENRAMRSLFARAQALDLVFGPELADAAARAGEPLELKDLDQENAALKRLLILLQAHAETADARLSCEIADHLAEWAGRRLVVLPAL